MFTCVGREQLLREAAETASELLSPAQHKPCAPLGSGRTQKVLSSQTADWGCGFAYSGRVPSLACHVSHVVKFVHPQQHSRSSEVLVVAYGAPVLGQEAI